MDRSLCIAITAGLILIPALALAAPHGKPGLWTITSTMTMANAPQLPPQVMEMMKKRGMPMMGQPTTSQMCMTAEQVNSGADVLKNHPVDCTPRVLHETANSAETEVTCHGMMDGVGHSRISWRGLDHYEGSYDFKGTMHGRPNDMSTHYTGDWVKSDCGAVKPFDAKSFAQHPAPPG